MLDITSCLPSPTPRDAEELISGLEQAMRQIGNWLGVPPERLDMDLRIIGCPQAFDLLSMPADAKDIIHQDTLQRVVDRRRLHLVMVKRAEGSNGRA